MDNILIQCKHCNVLFIKCVDHCCKCKKEWNKNKNKNHCGKCCTIYDPNKNHCCVCKKECNKNKNHCCKCKKEWNKNRNHCGKCCTVYDPTKNHCCKCKKEWNKNRNHCGKCCTVYDPTKNHCCNCRTVYDPTKNHCCNCRTVYDPIKNHCCNCRTVYDPIKNHCCNCRTVYDPTKNHCCKCKIEWNKNNSHCCNCCIMYNTEDKHCCICKNVSNCQCSENYNKLHYSIIEFLKQNNIFKYNLSPCLAKKCESYNRFNNGMKTLQFTHLDNLIDSNKYIFAFHGTPYLSGAQSICCNGWNINLRNGQAYGTGEYYTNKLNTAYNYARENGYIIITLIILSDMLKIINISDDEKYYVVKNNNLALFCLPVAITGGKLIVDFQCPTTYKNGLVDNFRTKTIKKLLYNDNSNWLKYREYELNQIIEHIKTSLIFDIVSSEGVTYNVNLIDEIQTNKQSGFVRKLMVVF